MSLASTAPAAGIRAWVGSRRWASAFARDGRGWLLVLLAAVLFLAGSLARTLHDPWVEEDTWYGAVYAQAAHNNLRAGLRVTAGVPVTLFYGPLPFPSTSYYVHHPTLLPLLVTASFAFFGESEAAARAAPIACSLLSVLLLWRLVRDSVGRRAAAFAVLIFATLPMQLHYGDMVDFEPPLLMLMLATLVCLHRWRVRGGAQWAWASAACAGLALWMDWPGYLFVLALAVWFWRRGGDGERRFAMALVALTAVSSAVFLLQIQHVNPSGLSDLATAVQMRLGNGVATGSSALLKESNAHFTLAQWCGTVFRGLREDYLPLPWLLAATGLGIVAVRAKGSPGMRQAGATAFLIGSVGAGYMGLLRNWSYIHDWASFYLTAPVAILGGVALDTALAWLAPRCAPRFFRAVVVAGIAAMALGFGLAGVRQSESMRSQFLMLDGVTPEPPTLTPDLGRTLAKLFPPETALLCNFDPYGSTLPYYAQRTILNGVGTAEEWNATMKDEQGPFGGVIWPGVPGVAELLASLPKDELKPLDVDGIRFIIWETAGHPR